MDSTLRPMSTGQVLDRTFHLYKGNFLLFAGISALPPAVLLLAQVSMLLLAFIPGTSIVSFFPEAAFVLGLIAMVVVYLVAFSLATGATVYAVSRVHLGHAVKIGESYKVIRPLIWRILRIVISVAVRFSGALLLTIIAGVAPFSLLRTLGPRYLTPANSTIVAWMVGLVVVVAVIVLFIWSIRLYCSYQLAVPVCVLEKLGAEACMKRSRFLSKGKGVQRILLVLFLSVILNYALILALSMPLFIFGILNVVKHTPSMAIPLAIWQYLSGFIAGTLAGPILTIALALMYYDERVRKEAFDLQLMMEAIGQAQPASMAAAAASGVAG
ncbi:MAG: hypothetical protein WA738_03995 [Candidatus Angelobacter sp.]